MLYQDLLIRLQEQLYRDPFLEGICGFLIQLWELPTFIVSIGTISWFLTSSYRYYSVYYNIVN